MEQNDKAKLTTFLANTDRSMLVQLLVQACEDNEKLYANVLQQMQKLHGTEFGALKRKVSEAVDAASRYSDYLEPSMIWDVEAALREVLLSAAAHADAGQTVEALDMAVYVLQTVSCLEESLEEGWELHATAEDAIECVSNIVAEADPSVYPAIADGVLAAAVDSRMGGEVTGSEYSLDMITAALPVINEDNKEAFLDAVDEVSGRVAETAEFAARRDIIRQAEGPEAAHAYMLERIDVDLFRKALMDEAVANGQFQQAEAMCVERIEQLQNERTDNRIRYGHAAVYLREWMRRLHDIYAASGETDKLAEQALRLVRDGDVDYYDEAKQLLTAADRWEAVYPGLLNELASVAHATDYMKILRKENEDALLLETIRDGHRGMILEYGAYLYPLHPEDVVKIAAELIEAQSEQVASRTHYRHIGDALEALASFGAAADALALLDSLVSRYSRRRAMKEELAASRDRIQHGDAAPETLSTYWR